MGRKKTGVEPVLEVVVETKIEKKIYQIEFGKASGRLTIEDGRATKIGLSPEKFDFTNNVYTFDEAGTKELLEVLNKLVSIAEAVRTLSE